MINTQNNMNQMKRQRDCSRSSDVQTKKSRTTFDDHFSSSLSITCLENLANELFYEIFDYLDACDIHKAFSNLNIRFENLLSHSSLSLTINLDSKAKSTLEHRCRHIIIPNKHRIISLHMKDHSLINDFFTQCNIDSSFHRLESVVLKGLLNYKLLMILFYINSLPRLYSLTIETEEDFYCSIGDIYRIVFRLPSLKYYKLSLSDYEELDISVPISINKEFSTVEHLVINHSCNLDELASILYHTPHLRHLNCQRLIETEEIPKKDLLMTLTNLTHISIGDCSVQFDEFEVFIRKISFQLNVLRLHTFSDSAYLDANRWKRLIKKHITHLKKFDFDHHAIVDDEYGAIPNHESINQFTSIFWTERQWFFKLKDDLDGLVYSIHPYRKEWFDSNEHMNMIPYSDRNTSKRITIPSGELTNHSFTPPIQLTIEGYDSETWDHTYIGGMKPTFLSVQFTDLNINCNGIPVDMLIEIIRLLPNLVSLEVSSLPLIQLDSLSFEDAEILLLASITNKIAKVKLDKMVELDQIHFLTSLCSRMQYLEVGCTTEIDIENIVGFVSMKNMTDIPYLNCLCLCVPNANEMISQNLDELIDFERLFHVEGAFRDYTIRRICNEIFLKWKL